MFLLPQTDESKLSPQSKVETCVDREVTLPGHLSPEISAVAMTIRWFKKTVYLPVLVGPGARGEGQQGQTESDHPGAGKRQRVSEAGTVQNVYEYTYVRSSMGSCCGRLQWG